jgi:TPP-dependent pyruvate/acetoin dehydrogenase alpha subunit
MSSMSDAASGYRVSTENKRGALARDPIARGFIVKKNLAYNAVRN